MAKGVRIELTLQKSKFCVLPLNEPSILIPLICQYTRQCKYKWYLQKFITLKKQIINGLSERTRTSNLHSPNVVAYQISLHLDRKLYLFILSTTKSVLGGIGESKENRTLVYGEKIRFPTTKRYSHIKCPLYLQRAYKRGIKT